MRHMTVGGLQERFNACRRSVPCVLHDGHPGACSDGAAAQTYDEWNRRGRKIIKGKKAIGFRDGKPLFWKEQTEPYNPATVNPESEYNHRAGEWEEMPH